MRYRLTLALVVAIGGCGGDGQETPAAASGPGGDAAAPAVPDPAGAIIEQQIAYGATEDRNLVAYMVLGADAIDLPGIILLHDRWGLDDAARTFARRLAGEGYAVLAPDFYDGRVPETDAAAERLVGSDLTDREVVMEQIAQALTYLEQFMLAPRIGVVGWSDGAGWALEAGIELGERIDAVVMYYGRFTTDARELERLAAPLLGNFADADRTIPPRDVLGFRGGLDRLGKDADVIVHREVGHGFAAPGRDTYDAGAAEAAWALTTAFLDEHLLADWSDR